MTSQPGRVSADCWQFRQVNPGVQAASMPQCNKRTRSAGHGHQGIKGLTRSPQGIPLCVDFKTMWVFGMARWSLGVCWNCRQSCQRRRYYLNSNKTNRFAGQSAKKTKFCAKGGILCPQQPCPANARGALWRGERWGLGQVCAGRRPKKWVASLHSFGTMPYRYLRPVL